MPQINLVIEDTVFPKYYCHLCDNLSGTTWIMELTGDMGVNPFVQGKRMLREILNGCAYAFKRSDPAVGSSPAWTSTIYTDGRTPDNGVCWDSCDIYFGMKEY